MYTFDEVLRAAPRTPGDIDRSKRMIRPAFSPEDRVELDIALENNDRMYRGLKPLTEREVSKRAVANTVEIPRS